MTTRFRSTSFVTVSAGSLAGFGKAINRFGPREHAGLTFGYTSVIRQTTGAERGKNKVLIDALSESGDEDQAHTAALETVVRALRHVGANLDQAVVETVSIA
ncbi:hypothetical protein [Gryllotalpicola protaetiae]|uniref:Uncharacterized protein n=1 Tax=Gryllotalpicola protaetiae TaxID=2419771 RepID=A0A387BLC0_9MICO|nr:hypothetical protein [Gryllotalpicola protaetiae]AYG04975.1 hypothetical protein D7I44_16575 [Gryllotalpicola protaetiae]